MKKKSVRDWEWKFRARLDRDVDGDTAWLIVDLGLRAMLQVEVRIADVNAPERGTPEGAAATAAANQWFADRTEEARLAKEKWPLEILTRKTEARERWLAKITPIAGGESLSEYLVRTGHAVPFMVGGSGV